MKRLPLALALILALPAAHAATSFDETRPLNADATVALDNLKGSIEVTVWDKPEIRITGARGEGTEALLIEGDAADLRVKIKYPESGGGWFNWGIGGDSGDSQLRVTVPVGVALNVETVSATVDVKGVAGKTLEIDNVSGDVMVDTGAAEIEINTVSGDATVDARSADATVESVSGDIELRGALTGRVNIEAVSGRLQLDSSAAAKHVNAGVVSGDIELRSGLQPGGRIQAESLSGDLTLILPAGVSAQLEASSFTGTIRSDKGEVKTEEHGPGSSLEATLGKGDGRIDLETFSGDLTVRHE